MSNGVAINGLLYGSTVLIWGTTWYAIALQVGDVPVMVSIFYRFALAAVLLLGGLKIMGRLHRIKRQDHLFCLLQGMCVFCFNFLCFYSANYYINSGLESVLFSMAILFNAVNGVIFLGQRLTRKLLIAGSFGISGIISLFWESLMAQDLSAETFYGIGLCLLGTYGFSIGNIITARHQKKGLDVLSTNAWAMLYGTCTMLAVILLTQTPFRFEASVSYVGALLYLAVFGSVVGFGSYFALVGRIGTGAAAYATVLFPLVALGVSTVYEGYIWTESAVVGLILILFGNVVMFYKPAQCVNQMRQAKQES
ncbi:putative DMT superfamily transporter inner membrane protein [Vibrio aerogenes CECT 7868]|uniref:Putative DMT superfamily transporter inner membrane protein n=1 Tax=Vibrio aerogenes CECT 7868 TaxID=1216006 RepID=A0A1M5VJ53_9VIBR|nr:DMT family transporter [Vibrio aerogenes]SHH75276.1 putative DMT superfamily transporter inner membrane protein [Vibrio aerogenes CECT 7868]